MSHKAKHLSYSILYNEHSRTFPEALTLNFLNKNKNGKYAGETNTVDEYTAICTHPTFYSFPRKKHASLENIPPQSPNKFPSRNITIISSASHKEPYIQSTVRSPSLK